MHRTAVPALKALAGPELLSLADAAFATGDREHLTLVWLELARRRRRRHALALSRRMARQGITPIPWLTLARDVLLHFRPSGRGTHHLYFVLLGGYGRDGNEYGIYVGETARRPEIRIEQHKRGIRDSGAVRRRGLQLLVSVGPHLSPLARAEAKRLEREIAAALQDAGIRVKGGH